MGEISGMAHNNTTGYSLLEIMINHTTRILFLLVTAALMLAGCSESEENDGTIFSQNKVWSLREITYPAGVSSQYPNGSGTYLAIYDNDSTRYECHWSFDDKADAILPQSKSLYLLIDKGGGEYLYLENGMPYPLTVLNDTTITIQHYGIVYTWQVEHSIYKRKMDEIRDLLVGLDYEDGKKYERFTFTKKEHELEEQNSMLGIYLTALLAVLAVVACLFLRTYRNKRRIETELLRLKTEQENRPQILTEALKNVEDEWLASDEYARLHKQIESGTLSYDDWSLMERQLNKIYPNFTHTLENLHHMSQMEHRVCMLIKLRVTPSEMAAVLNKEASTISTTRSRLYQKIFDKKGGAKDWDEFVMSL